MFFLFSVENEDDLFCIQNDGSDDSDEEEEEEEEEEGKTEKGKEEEKESKSNKELIEKLLKRNENIINSNSNINLDINSFSQNSFDQYLSQENDYGSFLRNHGLSANYELEIEINAHSFKGFFLYFIFFIFIFLFFILFFNFLNYLFLFFIFYFF